MTDKLKQFIFNNLIKDLSNVEIIRHDESLWFINREKKYWYLELVKTGKLYWRYQFFTEFFNMYSIDRDVYEPIIKEFVELVLNNGITSMGFTNRDKPFIVDSVLNDGITTKLRGGNATNQIESVLKNGVKSTDCEFLSLESEVDSILTNGVKTMTPYRFTNKKVMTVLNETVKDSIPLNANRETMIKYVLKDNPTNE